MPTVLLEQFNLKVALAMGKNLSRLETHGEATTIMVHGLKKTSSGLQNIESKPTITDLKT